MANSIVLLTVVFVFTSCQGAQIIVEKGQPTNLECSFPNNVSSITWQLLSGTTSVNISTCTIANTKCTDQTPLIYKGNIAVSGRGMNLQVNSVRTNETSFLCVADNSPNTTRFDLEVYAWPKKLELSQNISDSYIDYTCLVDNVYPDVLAQLHRSQADFTDSDFDHKNTNCTLGAPGSGADGDFSANCTWRVPTEHILLSNNITAAVSARIPGNQLINQSALVSPSLSSIFGTPRAVISRENCPDGPGVHLNTILIGTEATCLCESMWDDQPGARVDWYAGDAKAPQKTDQVLSTKLVISYNASDLGRKYECRAGSTLNTSTVSAYYTPEFRCSYKIVEKGQPTQLDCPVPATATSITWQLMNNGSVVRNISTCSLVTNNCTDLVPTLYKANITGSGNDRVSDLKVTGAKTNETQFTYLTDTGVRSSISEIEVYAWPKIPTCTQNMTDKFITYTCETSGAYPGVRGEIHKRKTDFKKTDIEINGTSCKMDSSTPATDGESSATCVFQIYSDALSDDTSNIYVEMTALVSNLSEVHRNAAVSSDIVTSFDTPVAVLVKCPVGLDVRDNVIKKGTSATCECLLTSYNYPGAYPQWYNDKNQKIGKLFNNTQSALLELNYNPSASPVTGPKETFYCQPVTYRGSMGTPNKYVPKVSAAVSLKTVTGLHMMVIVLGASLSGIVSRIA